MRHLLIASVVLCAPLFAQSPAPPVRFNGYCQRGAGSVTVSGLQSSPATPVQQSYPTCQVAVYITGSGGTLATIYSDANRTALSNPFTAAADGSYFFYANDGRYDGTFSSGGIVTPFTTGDQTGIAYRIQAGAGAVNRAYGDKIYDALSVKDFGAIGDGTLGNNSLGTDNSAAIQAAIAAASAMPGGAVYFPCGVYRHNSPLSDYYVASVSLVGAAENCVYLWYSGAATQSQLAVAAIQPSSPLANTLTTAWGFRLENITLVSNGNTVDGLTAYNLSFMHTSNTQIVGSSYAAYHLMGVQASEMDVPQSSKFGAVYNLWNGIPTTQNGILLDGWLGSSTVGPLTVNAPIVEYLSGIGIWLKYANSVTVTGAQDSNNLESLQVDLASPANTFVNCLWEGNGTPGAMGNVVVAGLFNTFIGGAISNANFTISGYGNQILNGGYNGGTLIIANTASNTRIHGINTAAFGAGIVDSAPDTEYEGMQDASSPGMLVNFPVYVRHLPNGQRFLGVSVDGPAIYEGTWQLTGPAMNISPNPINLPGGSLWTVQLDGFANVGGVGSVPLHATALSTSPSITIANSTLTLAVSGGNHLTMAAGGGFSGNIVFSGTVSYTPLVLLPAARPEWSVISSATATTITENAVKSFYYNNCQNPSVFYLPAISTFANPSGGDGETRTYNFREFTGCGGVIKVVLAGGNQAVMGEGITSSGGFMANSSAPTGSDELECRPAGSTWWYCTPLFGVWTTDTGATGTGGH